MKFEEVCEKLGIGKYAERIYNSHSRGELHFLQDYYQILEVAEENEGFAKVFPEWFEEVVASAEKEWQRPDTVFQHILTILRKDMEAIEKVESNV